MSQQKQCHKCNELKNLSCFSKHSGTKDKLDQRCKQCVNQLKQKRKNETAKEYPIFEIDLNTKEWQGGKPTGSILDREDSNSKSTRFEVRIPLGGGKAKSKSFQYNETNRDLMHKEALAWLKKFSKENNLTRNMIRIIDDNTFEVSLTQGYIMKTDISFLDICQKHILCAGKPGRDNADYYSIIVINNKNILFHKYITGYDMTDHINRDPMDNRLENLRKTTPKLNNNNRNPSKKYLENNFHKLGVRFLNKDESWQARIKQNGTEYTKSFSVKKYGYEEAKQLAINARQEFNEKFNCSND
tara:strand:- start:65 stop:964 length:900 start_codon:yes stop_codon:yes gene_type:complete